MSTSALRRLAAASCLSVLAVLAVAPAARGEQLFDNGPVVTDPTGGTGTIAGQPISRGDPVPLGGGLVGFTHINANGTAGQRVADDFVVPAGKAWNLDTATLYASRSGATTPIVNQITINLWTAPPFSANSPAPVPDPLPTPVLATSLTLDAGPGTLVAYRQSSVAATNNATRPVFAYTVSLDGLPDGGQLAAGSYWLEWSFIATGGVAMQASPTPRASSFNANARLFTSIDGGANTPYSWFEGREPPTVAGLPYALPFTLNGTSVPEPGMIAVVVGVGATALRRR